MTASAATVLRLGLHLLLALCLLLQAPALSAAGTLHALGEESAAVAAPSAGVESKASTSADAPACDAHPAKNHASPAGGDAGCTELCVWVCSMSAAALLPLAPPAPPVPLERPAPRMGESFVTVRMPPPQRPPIAS